MPTVTAQSKRQGQASARFDLANRLFFRLYQCANLLHKTGTRAVEAEGLTTQQWAVLGALSRERAREGMGVGELARYLMVTRQNLSGLISRMERDGHVRVAIGGHDRRARVVTMTRSGRHVWEDLAQPKIRAYYEQVLSDFSGDDLSHALHYLLKLLGNMQRVDAGEPAGDEARAPAAQEKGPARSGAPGPQPAPAGGAVRQTGRRRAPARTDQ